MQFSSGKVAFPHLGTARTAQINCSHSDGDDLLHLGDQRPGGINVALLEPRQHTSKRSQQFQRVVLGYDANLKEGRAVFEKPDCQLLRFHHRLLIVFDES
ncbi:hypothetical protein PMAYCL1PPCAC_10551, partial [Pristionchus mayeri]